MSIKIQYIFVFIILAAILAWIIYSLVTKKYNNVSSCAGCALADSCKKKELKDRGGKMPVSCDDCPETDSCDRKGTFFECGAPGHSGESK